MVGRPFYVEPHGDRLHVHAILEAKLVCRERGYRELDHEALARKQLYPGIPDLYIEAKIRRTNERGQASHDWTRYIIEIETDATAASIRKKTAQFDTSLAGHEMLPINLRKCKDPKDIDELRKFLEEWLP